jgi:LysM repeat protein
MVAVASASTGNCSLATVKGVYGYLVTGFDENGPKAVLGQGTADGNGNITGWVTINENGTIYQKVPFTATYTVAKNCTGSMTINMPGLPVRTENFFLNDDKRSGYTIRTDGGAESGVIVAQGDATCGMHQRRRIYAEEAAGVCQLCGPPPVQTTWAGQDILYGNGNVSGTATVSLGGAPGTGPVTGTYTENADCTGTAVVAVAGGPPATFSYVVVNGGKEMLKIEIDANMTMSEILLLLNKREDRDDRQ